jgi:hypothetical protein
VSCLPTHLLKHDTRCSDQPSGNITIDFYDQAVPPVSPLHPTPTPTLTPTTSTGGILNHAKAVNPLHKPSAHSQQSADVGNNSEISTSVISKHYLRMQSCSCITPRHRTPSCSPNHAQLSSTLPEKQLQNHQLACPQDVLIHNANPAQQAQIHQTIAEQAWKDNALLHICCRSCRCCGTSSMQICIRHS